MQIAPRLVERYEQINYSDLAWELGQEKNLIRKLSIKLDMSQDELIHKMKELITEKA